MKKPCVHCSHPTNRFDSVCLNCTAKDQHGLHQSHVEPLAIADHKFTCACGENNPHALILLEHNGASGREPKSKSVVYRDARAFLVYDQPNQYFARCYNCQQAIYNRPPGRPPKYKTHEEREFIRKNRTKIYLANLIRKVIQSYGIDGVWPSCVMCDSPATRTLFIGEFGKAPVGNQYVHCRRLALTEPHWHNQFAPYCEHHEVMNIAQRGKEYRRIQDERATDAREKSTRDIFALSL